MYQFQCGTLMAIHPNTAVAPATITRRPKPHAVSDSTHANTSAARMHVTSCLTRLGAMLWLIGLPPGWYTTNAYGLPRVSSAKACIAAVSLIFSGEMLGYM